VSKLLFNNESTTLFLTIVQMHDKWQGQDLDKDGLQNKKPDGSHSAVRFFYPLWEAWS